MRVSFRTVIVTGTIALAPVLLISKIMVKADRFKITVSKGYFLPVDLNPIEPPEEERIEASNPTQTFRL
jgi:hypothetical protein